MNPDEVRIPREEFERIQTKLAFLDALAEAGLAQWAGIDKTLDIMNQRSDK